MLKAYLHPKKKPNDRHWRSTGGGSSSRGRLTSRDLRPRFRRDRAERNAPLTNAGLEEIENLIRFIDCS